MSNDLPLNSSRTPITKGGEGLGEGHKEKPCGVFSHLCNLRAREGDREGLCHGRRRRRVQQDESSCTRGQHDFGCAVQRL
jgi:hypothetical protein